jgi:hypothetical protein
MIFCQLIGMHVSSHMLPSEDFCERICGLVCGVR